MNDILGAKPNEMPIEAANINVPKDDMAKFRAKQREYADEVKETYESVCSCLDEFNKINTEMGSTDDIVVGGFIACLNAMKVMLKGNMPVEI